MSKRIKIPEPISGIIKNTREIILFILKTEFATDAGKINALSIFLLFILTLVIIIPDYFVGFINSILLFLNKPQLPQLPTYGILAYLFMLPALSVWCVWYVVRSGKFKKK